MGAQPAGGLRRRWVVVAVVLCALVVVAAAFAQRVRRDALSGMSGGAAAEERPADPEADAPAVLGAPASPDPATAPTTLSDLDLSAIPAAAEPTSFSLADGDATPVDPASSLCAAIQDAERLGHLSLLLLDCGTGAGVAYGTDTTVYSASTFKAVYAAYVCSELIESGQVTRETICPVLEGDEYDGTYGVPGRSYYLGTLLEALITESDNDAFRILHVNLDRLGYASWMLERFGEEVFEPASYYQFVSARTMAQAWSFVADYLESGTETAAWLGSLLSQTGTSFIRSALADTGAQVRNKAGWYANDPTYNSTSDVGLVELDGSSYLVVALSDMPACSQSEQALEGVIRALFEALPASDAN